MKSILFVLANLLCRVHSFNVLAIFSIVDPEHIAAGVTILNGLAQRDHNVTLINSMPTMDPAGNFSEVQIWPGQHVLGEEPIVGFIDKELQPVSLGEKYNQQVNYAENVLSSIRVQQMISSNSTFDVVIIDWHRSYSLLDFGRIYKCPIVLLSMQGSTPSTNAYIGNTAPPHYVAARTYAPLDKVSDRGYNLLAMLWERMLNSYVYYQHKTLLSKYHAEGDLNVGKDKVAIVLTNDHPSFKPLHPSVPAEVNVGGFHLKKKGTLDLKTTKFLDSASEGAIYVEIGNYDCRSINALEVMALADRYGLDKYHVVWRFDYPVATVKNRIVKKVVNRTAVMAHKNIKLYISTGNMFGIIDAIRTGVPILRLGYDPDQKEYLDFLQSLGIAYVIPKHTRNEVLVKYILTNVTMMMNNKTYLDNMDERRRMLENQPEDPLAKAIHWIELLMKFNQTAALVQSASREMPMPSFAMNDILTILVTIKLLTAFYRFFSNVGYRLEFDFMLIHPGQEETANAVLTRESVRMMGGAPRSDAVAVDDEVYFDAR